jgi:23S rRNA (guanosine2251-2'-O)-methyltransferase
MGLSQIIAGRKPVMEALRAGTQIEKIVFLVGMHGKVIENIKLAARERRVQVVEVNRQSFRDLASNATTQGVVAVVPTKQYVDIDLILNVGRQRDQKGFVLLLDEVEDPQNLGALVRTAECAGAHGVIIPKHHAASVTTAVVKASAGATEHVAMARVTNVVNAMEELKGEGFWVVGLDMAGEELYTNIDYTVPIAVVVGREGKGIRRLVKEHCDKLVRIPLYGKIDSLNASVAGALVLYEVAKQRELR